MLLTAGLALSYLLATNQRMQNTINDYDYPLARMDDLTVTIIMPVLDEEENVADALADLENQNIRDAYPDKFEVFVVDNGCEDCTMEIARKFDVSTFKTMPAKLTAIDSVIDLANGNIIVAVDADTRYPPNFLNLLLEHFEDPEVVAVSGFGFYGNNPAIAHLAEMWRWVRPKMQGCGSAYRKEAYLRAGRFDWSIDQQDSMAMVNEEEQWFYDRLSQLGKVVQDRRVTIKSSDRRVECLLGSDSAYCQALRAKQRF